jgi:hypothetical protein
MAIVLTRFTTNKGSEYCGELFLSLVSFFTFAYYNFAFATARVFGFVDKHLLSFVSDMPLTKLGDYLIGRKQFVDYQGIFFISSFLQSGVGYTVLAVSLYEQRVRSSVLRDHLDVEQKPIYAIGLVVGGLLAILWWAAAVATFFF